MKKYRPTLCPVPSKNIPNLVRTSRPTDNVRQQPILIIFGRNVTENKRPKGRYLPYPVSASKPKIGPSRIFLNRHWCQQFFCATAWRWRNSSVTYWQAEVFWRRWTPTTSVDRWWGTWWSSRCPASEDRRRAPHRPPLTTHDTQSRLRRLHDHAGETFVLQNPSSNSMSNETLKKTRCKAKPVGSPPAYPLTACYLLLICQLIGTPVFSAALALFSANSPKPPPSWR